MDNQHAEILNIRTYVPKVLEVVILRAPAQILNRQFVFLSPSRENIGNEVKELLARLNETAFEFAL